MQTATRRNLLLGTAGIAAFASMGQLSSCSSTTPANGVVPAVLDVINKIISGTCQIIPVVQTLVDVIIAVFPAAAGVAVITDALAQQIATYVCNLFKVAGVENIRNADLPGSFKADLKGTSIPLHGYTIVSNKLVYF